MVQEMQTPAIAQILEQLGFDFFMIDMESGAYSLETATNILRVGRLLEMCPLVRVASLEYHLIARVLDQGAMGVMLPRVEKCSEVEMLVETMKYPPMGKRGFASSAPHTDYLSSPVPEFLEVNNQDTLVIAQIELKAAVDRIDEILAVPGIHVALVGPQDLAISLGVPGETGHPIVVDAIDKVLASAQKQDVVAGIHMGKIAPLKIWMEKGMRMIMLGSDLSFLMSAGREGLTQLRE
jgi:2-dehydro-3-deoxyglucarate aldolase/4-hydroxy-2-oxoheptanedioate aldolase|tara:strand:- start:7990 stop:8700 length:711 start_codon:yes stop_codon:yes gene_type:complete